MIGVFNVEVRGYTAADDDMLCLKIRMDFRNRPFFGIF